MLTEAYAAVSADYGALHDSHLVYCDEGGVPCDRASNRRLGEKLHHRRLDGHMNGTNGTNGTNDDDSSGSSGSGDSGSSSGAAAADSSFAETKAMSAAAAFAVGVMIAVVA